MRFRHDVKYLQGFSPPLISPAPNPAMMINDIHGHGYGTVGNVNNLEFPLLKYYLTESRGIRARQERGINPDQNTGHRSVHPFTHPPHPYPPAGGVNTAGMAEHHEIDAPHHRNSETVK